MEIESEKARSVNDSEKKEEKRMQREENAKKE